MTSLTALRAQYPQYDSLSDGDFLYGIKRKYYPDMHPRQFFDAIDGAKNASATIKMFRDEYREAVKAPLPGEDQDSAARRLYGTAEGPVGNPGGRGAVAARSALQGLTFGAGDEIVARGASLLGGGDYETELQRERDRLALGRDQNPAIAATAEIGGALALPGAILKPLRGRPVAEAGRSAGLAGLGGFLYGFNSGEGGRDERLRNAAVTASLSGILGAGAPAVGGLIERGLNSRAARGLQRELAKIAPDMDGLRARAGRIFDQADTVGLPANDLPNAVSSISRRISRRPINAQVTPKAAGVMSDLEDVATRPGGSVMFGELQDIRRLANAGASDFTNPAEQRAAGIIQEGIDEFVNNADPNLAPQIAEARKMWSQLRKSEVIQDVVEKAERQASGFENGLRIGIRQILNNKKRRAGFTRAEIEAMEAIVKGTPFGNVMKKLGRLSFGMGQQTNVLSGLTGSGIAGGLGMSALGPAGAALGLIPPLIGYGAKRASQNTTEQGIKALQGLIVSPNQTPSVISEVGRGLIDELVRRGARSPAAFGLPETALELQSLMAQ